MKHTKLFKRIGAVVTTVAMIASMGVTGFAAADPGEMITYSAIGENGVFDVTISLADATAETVTMLAYVAGDENEAVTELNLVGMDQVSSDEVVFSVSVAKGTGAMDLGESGIVLLRADNEAVAYFFTAPDAVAEDAAVDGSVEVTVPYYTAEADVNEALIAALADAEFEVALTNDAFNGGEDSFTLTSAMLENANIAIGDANIEVSFEEEVAGDAGKLTLAANTVLEVPFTVTEEAMTVTEAALVTTEYTFSTADANAVKAAIVAAGVTVGDGTYTETLAGEALADALTVELGDPVEETAAKTKYLATVTLNAGEYMDGNVVLTDAVEAEVVVWVVEISEGEKLINSVEAVYETPELDKTATEDDIIAAAKAAVTSFTVNTTDYADNTADDDAEAAAWLAAKDAVLADAAITAGGAGEVGDVTVTFTVSDIPASEGATILTSEVTFTVVVEVTDAWAVAEVAATTPVNVEVGATVADVQAAIAAANATVKVMNGDLFENWEVAAEAWTSEDYNAATPDDYTFTATLIDAEEGGAYLTDATTVDVTVTVTNAWEITAVAATTPVNVAFDATVADVQAAIAAANATVKVMNGDLFENWAVAANAWAGAGYNAVVPGEYTFTATLTDAVEGGAYLGDVTTVDVTVTVDKLDLSVENDKVEIVVPGYSVMQDEAAEAPMTAAEVLALLNAEDGIKTLEVKYAGEVLGTLNVTWTVEGEPPALDLTVPTVNDENNKMVVKVDTVEIATGAEKMTGTPASIEMTVEVDAAVIIGGTVEIITLSESSKPKVTVKVPATTELKETGNEIVVVIADNNGNEYTLSAVADKNDFKPVGNYLRYTIEGTERFKDIEGADFAYDQKNKENNNITVSATVNAAPVADENGNPIVVDARITISVAGGGGGGGAASTPGGTGGNGGAGVDQPVVTTSFSDVPASHWAYAYIETLKDADVISGNEDGTFAPDDTITRAELTKMVVNVAGLETTGTSVFEDCGPNDWFTPFVAAAAEAGLVNGHSETEFAPNEYIVRQDAVTIIGRLIGAAPSPEAKFDYRDADQVSDYALNYMKAFVEMGFVKGYNDGAIRPNNYITRAEVAKIVAMVMDIVNPK